jgi:HK97 family phage major capsid protein
VNPDQLREALEAAQTELRTRNETMLAAQRAIDEAGEDADLEQLRTTFEEAGTAFDEQADEVDRCKRNLADAERRARVLEENPEPVREAAAGTVRVGREALTYRADQHSPFDFVRDVFAVQFGSDPVAGERLARSNREQADLYRERHGREQRDVGTGALTGFTIPQFLIDEYAPLARAGAPFLAALSNVTKPLPVEGMVISIPRGTTGTAVAAQATENSGVQETDFDDTKLDVDIRQYAGQNDLSRQAVQRSRESVNTIFGDLISDWWTKADDACLNGAGTSGTVLGVRSVSGITAITYTDASPTVPELYPKIGGAKNGIITGRHAPPLLMLMHGRRWEWILVALDSSNRPLAVPDPQGPFNALAVGDAPEYGAVVGQMQALPVITDNNIPTNLGTNEDAIIVTRPTDHRLWLDPGGPMQFSFEQVAPPQSVRLAVWGEIAFTAGRYPLASSVIGGTGLIAPTF